MEVVNPSPAVDFNFHCGLGSPYATAPSSPQRFFYSAPASPRAVVSPSSVPFGWEDKPGLPKGQVSAPSSNHGDFAFDFGGHLDPSPAEELFAGGKIKPLKPPPRFQYDTNNNNGDKSPRSPTQFIREALSPRRRAKVDFDPFAAALERARREGSRRNGEEKKGSRERTRSLFEPDPVREPVKAPSPWYKKWRIKDLLLFRSASEELGKYETEKRRFRRDEEGDIRSSRRSGPSISMHYAVNRQHWEEMKKRSFLPYKQGLLGCLGFHPTAPDVSTKGIN